ncbi:hypothetical protein BDU57DRAFT_118220 [Ampelomyces quisqualis]|uniref:Uncharacterized protein n=1 Tax=Ampelomyces quisqualis TaxID=50730 RepID=A0A6A5QVW3_AMPQU|nr:hypothetical protein BDU57DRAFT_118220 [Ampelomyces quisqualis]
MARTHSSYTASPIRDRSPRRSPARRPSKDGSEYEMDLDALGLNSTFESTELQASYEPPVDRVDTSEIEGPEDFTMNMTYWMTADLPLAQIKSRKEAKSRARIDDGRMDAMKEEEVVQENTEEGDQVIIELNARNQQDGKSHTATPTKCANGTTDERNYSTPASERSMENDEKVRSFLSNLPDTDMEGAIAGTPLHLPRQSFLQVPRSSPPKARSLQPTVEDYDTPRKPTQETVIHHTSAVIDTNTHKALQDQIAQLQAQMGQQDLTLKTRITELETILSYTRSELDTARTDNYRQSERTARLEKDVEQQRVQAEAARSSVAAQLKAKEDALDSKMHDYGEEMRLQNLTKLQDQRDDFERQLQALHESKRLMQEEVVSRDRTLEQVRGELVEVRRSNAEQLQERNQKESKVDDSDKVASKERIELTQQLSTVQARAEDLETQLHKAAAEAKAMREDAAKRQDARNVMETRTRTGTTRISELETNLRAARFELECAQADISAKQQLFRTNLDLNSRLRTLQSDLEAARSEAHAKNQQSSQDSELQSRLTMLQDRLQSSRAEAFAKDEEIMQHIRSQEKLEEAYNTAQGLHRGNAKSRTDKERIERDLEDVNERLHDAQAESDRRVADVEQKLNRMKEAKLEAERKFREFQYQHDDLVEGHEAMLEDVRDKAEDAVRKAGAMLDQERNEKKRIIKDLKRTKYELETLRTEAEEGAVAEDESCDDSTLSRSSTTAKEKDMEIANLRNIIRKQMSEMKNLRAETTSLRKESKKYKFTAESQTDLEATIRDLKDELKALRTENATLQARLEDQEAVNAAMDEKMATLVSRVMKERAKTVVGKRDGQWQESVGHVQNENELLGKVLLRQWGREELGIADEKHGEKQTYRYRYAKRERE